MWSIFKKKYPIKLPSGSHSLTNNLIDRDVLDILTRLRRNGYESYLVGGGVRDILMGKKAKDLDLVTNAHPKQIKRLFRRCFLIGRRFRLAHVYVSHERFIEVATFRALVDPDEVKDNDKRYAENNIFGTIDEDVLRRDFTVNALYYNSADSSILDYTGGIQDLEKKILRSIGDPMERFRDDPVRIIRAGRFCAQLDFKMPRRELKAAISCAPLIAETNSNRLLEELYKILRCGASAKTFILLNKFGVLRHWLPDITREKNTASILRRLEIVDKRRARGQEISNCVLITALIYDLIADKNNDSPDRIGFQDALAAMQKSRNDLAVRMRLPKKEWERICNAATRLRFMLKPGGKKPGKGEIKFVQGPFFDDALRFFEIYAESVGGLESQLKYWWQLERENTPDEQAAKPRHAAQPKRVTRPAPKGRTPRTSEKAATTATTAEPVESPKSEPAPSNQEQDVKKKRKRRRRPRKRKPSEEAQTPPEAQPES